MALKQSTKDKIKDFGFDIDKLISAITATEEVDFELPADVVYMKMNELETRDSNSRNEGRRAGELEGEKKGKELAAKAFRRKFGIEESLPPDVDKIAEAVTAKLSQGDQGLKDQIALLQADKESLVREKEIAIKNAESAAFDSELISLFPANRNSDLTDAERLVLVKMNRTFDVVDGKKVVKHNGEVIRNATTKAPIELKDAILEVFTEKNWLSTQQIGGGRGAGNNTPPAGANGIKKASAFESKWLTENPGKNLLSDEYINALSEQAKSVPDFDMYS